MSGLPGSGGVAAAVIELPRTRAHDHQRPGIIGWRYRLRLRRASNLWVSAPDAVGCSTGAARTRETMSEPFRVNTAGRADPTLSGSAERRPARTASASHDRGMNPPGDAMTTIYYEKDDDPGAGARRGQPTQADKPADFSYPGNRCWETGSTRSRSSYPRVVRRPRRSLTTSTHVTTTYGLATNHSHRVPCASLQTCTYAIE